MQRREFFKLSLMALAGGMVPRYAGAAPWRAEKTPPIEKTAAFYVPGNAQKTLYFEGVPIREHPELARAMRKFEGSPVLLTRVDEADRSVRRALFPVKGHSVEVHPNGRTAVCNGQNAATMVAFDPTTLDMLALLEYEDGFLAGGHSVYLPDGKTMVVTERLPYTRYKGTPAAHYGRLAIRDNDSLSLLDKFSCGGIAPHDINLLEDGKHVAVSNYGSTNWPEGQLGYDRYRVDPSVVILEVATGKVVERYDYLSRPGPNQSLERHEAYQNPVRPMVGALDHRSRHKPFQTSGSRRTFKVSRPCGSILLRNLAGTGGQILAFWRGSAD